MVRYTKSGLTTPFILTDRAGGLCLFRRECASFAIKGVMKADLVLHCVNATYIFKQFLAKDGALHYVNAPYIFKRFLVLSSGFVRSYKCRGR
jgi:hypothetical protein